MKRHLCLLLMTLAGLYGQEPPAADAAKPKPEAEAAKPEAEAPPKKVMATESADDRANTTPDKQQSMLFEAGIRWVDDVAGDYNTYRSVVNLGEGWRVTRFEYNLRKPEGRFADEVHFRGADWGGDPYNSIFLDIGKSRQYLYRGSYTNIAYFNYLPSFANPGLGTLGTGILMNERAYDTRIRNYENELQFIPGGILTPYVAFSRNSTLGNGVTNLVVTGNEYPLRNVVNWSQYNGRGGLRLSMKRFHATVEQGWLSFKDDQGVYSTERMQGNRLGQPYLGQQLFLTDGRQYYRTRGDGAFTTAQVTANPWDWIDLAGFFIRSEPSTETDFTQEQAGNFSASPSVFFQQGTDQFFGGATMPRTSWTGSAEIRPFSRLRIREIFETDRLVNNSFGALTMSIRTGMAQALSTTNIVDRLEVNQSRQQVEALFDLARGVVARGGYRYEFGRSLARGGNLNPALQERGELERHVGLAGVQVRPVSRLLLNADLEVGSGEETYYRTGLYDTVRFRAQGRVTLPKDLVFQAIYLRFNNQNPNEGIDYDYAAQSVNASLQWLPKGGSNFSLLADYNRSTIRSDIYYLAPQILQPERSLYRDNAHTGTLMADMAIPILSTYRGRLTAGGSFVHTSGSRPSKFFQPQGRFSVPFADRVDLFVEWRYWGLSQAFYTYEGFRTHAVTTGLRFHL